MSKKATLTPEEIQDKRQEIVNLTSLLTSTESSIGDWKIVKTYEARLQELEDPYDMSALMAQRQEVRDRINALQAEIDAAENQ